MNNFKIACLGGDGIGPEVVEQATKVLKSIGERFNIDFEIKQGLIGACAIDELNNPYPKQTHDLCLESDAVLLGAVGEPKYDNNPKISIRPEQGLLKMRKDLEIFANIRPIKPFKNILKSSTLKEEVIKNVDFIVIRELTGGIYFGSPRGRSEDGSRAFDTCVYKENEIKRIYDLAIEFANKRDKKLTIVDKANVLATSRLWRELSNKYEKKNTHIEHEYMFVDNAAMQLVLNPSKFDIILTENMFGDILTDLASVISGSLGLIPSASIGDKTSVFEPIHGSYPQAKGKDIANPLATILSVSLMLDNFGLKKASQAIECSVIKSIEKGFVTEDLDKSKGRKTSEVGDWIANDILKG